MITQKFHKIKISEVEALKTKAYIDKGATYDKGKGELAFTANEATGESFRLVHDDKKAFIIEGANETVTTSLYTIEEFNTEQEALDRIKVLNLEHDPPAQKKMKKNKPLGK